MAMTSHRVSPYFGKLPFCMSTNKQRDLFDEQVKGANFYVHTDTWGKGDMYNIW